MSINLLFRKALAKDAMDPGFFELGPVVTKITVIILLSRVRNVDFCF
jgi:hypothetical protein